MRNKFLVIGVLAAILIVPALILGVLVLVTQESRTPPVAITGLTTIDAHDGKIDLAWNPSTAEDFAYYAIYVSETEITGTTELFSVGQINDRADASYQVTGYQISGLALALANDTEYWFAVTAVDLAGNESEAGTSVSATSTKIEDTSSDLVSTVFNITLEAGSQPPPERDEALAKVAYPDVTIAIGTTVVWTNLDDDLHTITSDNGLFDSGYILIGDTFSYTFTKVGIYYYHCDLHLLEAGTVTVETGLSS